MKAVIIVVPDERADDVSRLLAATLTMNGYVHDGPAVVDWPPNPETETG